MDWPLKHGWRGWLWPLALGSLIVVASGRSAVAAPDIVGIDKVTHFLVFGLLGTLVVRNGFAAGGWAWVAVLAVSAFGLTDEWHQSFTPGRRVEIADWIADTLGAIVAVASYVHWPAYRRRLEADLKSRVENPAAIPPNQDVA